MRKGILTLGCLILFIGATALYGGTSPVGKWKTIDDETGKAKSYVEIYEKDGVFYGKIMKLIVKEGEDPNPLCDKCKGRFKNKPVVGMVILWGLKKDGDEYSGGKIMDPKNGKIYKCLIKVTDGGKKLKVRGYIGFSLIGRNQYWHKAN